MNLTRHQTPATGDMYVRSPAEKTAPRQQAENTNEKSTWHASSQAKEKKTGDRRAYRRY